MLIFYYHIYKIILHYFLYQIPAMMYENSVFTENTKRHLRELGANTVPV